MLSWGLADLLLCGGHLSGLQHLLHISVQFPSGSVHEALAVSLLQVRDMSSKSAEDRLIQVQEVQNCTL